MPKLTVEDIFKWVLKHRKNKVFRRMTNGEILSRICSSCLLGRIIVATNTKGEIEGVIIYEIPREKTLYILHLLATTKQAFKHFARIYQQCFQDFTIEADRYDEFIQYKNTRRLINLIQKI